MTAVTAVKPTQQMMNFQKSWVITLCLVSPNWKKFVPKIDCKKQLGQGGEYHVCRRMRL